MKKALWLIAALVLALVLVTGCEQETLEVKLADVGCENYKLSGKTLVNTDTDYYTKVVSETNVQTSTVFPVRTKVTTVTFNKDGTWTSSSVTTNLAAIDGDYRTESTGSVVTSYSDENDDLIDATYAGRGGVVINTVNSSGNWISYEKQDDVQADKTLYYRWSQTTGVSVSQGFSRARTSLPADATHGIADKYTYTKNASTFTSNDSYEVDDYSELVYSYVGEQKVDGKTKDVVRFWGADYIVQ